MMGKPLLHKRIAEYTAKAKARGHHVVLTTNGALMTEDRARALLLAH